MKISYYSNGITQTEPDRQATVTEIMSDIKGTALVAKTKALRAETDKDKQAGLKAALPYVTWSGTFAKRRKKDPMLKPSGLLCLDFDDLSDAKRTKAKLVDDQYVHVMFISPRGNGLKVVVQIPADAENHEKYFAAAACYFDKIYGLKADESGKDVSRACFLCHDPDMIFHEKSLLFDAMHEPVAPERPQIEMALDDLENLEPRDMGDYWDLKCPACGQHDAYMYKNSWILRCSHKNSCGFERNILEERIEAKLKALQESPKNKRLRTTLYALIRNLDEVERDLRFKGIGKIVGASLHAIRKDFENHVREKVEAEFHADGGVRFAQPDGWQIQEDGIYNFRRQRVTVQPVYVDSLGYARKGGAEYVNLVYGANGTRKQKTVPRRAVAISKDLLELSDFGAPVTSANSLDVVRFLDAWVARNRDAMGTFTAVDQLGWDSHNGAMHFVFPDRIIGDTSGEAIHFIDGTIDKSAFVKVGTLEGWVAAVKEMTSFPDAIVGRFLVYAAFAGLILEPLNRRPFIIHLHGDTSTSKTTALRLVTSIFGQPLEGRGMIKWNNTQAFLTRYMEKLKNIPLVIDESSGETRNIFETTIYMMESGTSKGKALKSDPLGTAPIRTFRCAVFSSGEPPVLKEEFLSGAQVRVIEFATSPWGGVLPREQYEEWTAKIQANYGHAADAFIEWFLRNRDEIDWEVIQTGDNDLSPVESRVKKVVNLIWTCGLVVNELFGLGFDVDEDCAKVFEVIRGQLEEKQKSAERILGDIHDYYQENQANFLVTSIDKFTGKISAPEPKAGKVYGYVLNDGHDLGFIKGPLKEYMSRRHPNGGDWAIHRLKESQVIPSTRTQRWINGVIHNLIFFHNFFKHEETF